MGKLFKSKTPKSSASVSGNTVTAAEEVAPATAQDMEQNVEMAQDDQRRARSNLRGIRSTYAEASGAGSNGSKARLG